MALEKVTYVDEVTIIGAKNLNDIQDELIRQGEQQTEDEAELALKANATDMQTALALKADKSDTYTKAEVNEALGLKANTADVNEALALKADKTETYTKAQVDEMVQDAIAEAVKESEYSNFEMKSVSGDFIHITDGAGLIPVKDLKIGIEAVQDLHGQANPYPAGGGKNLLNVGGRVTHTSAGVNYTSNENYVIMNGTKSGSTYAGLNDLSVELPAGTYYAKAFEISGSTSGNAQYFVNDFTNDLTANIVGTERTFTLEATTTIRFRVAIWTDGTTFTNYTIGIVISKTSGISEWSPYSNICPISGRTGANIYVSPTADEEDATVYSVTWEDEAGTVYGGTLDVTTGVLTVTHGFYTYDNISVSGATSVTGGLRVNFPCPIGDINRGKLSLQADGFPVFDRLIAGGALSLGTISKGYSANDYTTIVNASNATEANALLEDMTIMFKLATPQTYQLTPTEVLTLLGENNIFADTGAIDELIYRISRQA